MRGTIGWDAPLDALSELSAVVRLAQKIATAVKSWVDGGLVVGDGVPPSDPLRRRRHCTRSPAWRAI